MNWTQSDYNSFLARRLTSQAPSGQRAIESESKLHDQILDECRRRGWIALHGSMAHRTFRNAGEFDFIVAADRGRTFLIEAKTATSKLSVAQQAMHAQARHLGHKPAVVRSLAEFLEVVK